MFECARAFTGWAFINEYEGIPSPPVPREFQYYEDDHDNGEKTFLGHTGNFDGEDIIVDATLMTKKEAQAAMKALSPAKKAVKKKAKK